MKYPALVAVLLATSVVAHAAETKPSKNTQTGKLSTVRLLATARAVGKAAPPDGMRFLFLVTPTTAANGDLAIKETRDFLIGGESYQATTHATLGKKFEPGTNLDTAENFFRKQPSMRHLAPDNIKGAHIVSLAIGGAPLEAGAKVEVTLNVGFDKEIEPFTFSMPVPPGRSSEQKKT